MPPLQSLAAAAPLLEVLSVAGTCDDDANAKAVVGHPCLQDLRLDCAESIVQADKVRPEEAWLRAAQRPPALARLAFWVYPERSGPEEVEGHEPEEMEENDYACTAWLQRTFGLLYDCKRLTHLEFAVETAEPIPLHELLAGVGGAVGRRLRSFTLAGAEVPHTSAVSAALHTVAEGFPLLEVLVLQLSEPKTRPDAGSGFTALLWDVLVPMQALAPLCPALREVRLEGSPLEWYAGAVPKASWVRTGA